MAPRRPERVLDEPTSLFYLHQQMRHMKRITVLGSLASICFIVGCSDPADKVHKSAATEPQKPAAPPAASAKEYVIRSESKIGFVGSKVTGKHNGGFKSFAGKFSISD